MGGVLDRANSGETAGTAERSGWSGGVSGVRVESLRDRADVAGRRRDFDGGHAGAAESLNERHNGQEKSRNDKRQKGKLGRKNEKSLQHRVAGGSCLPRLHFPFLGRFGGA